MKGIIKLLAGITFLLLSPSLRAGELPIISMDSILLKIDRQNIQLQTYILRAESFRYSAAAAMAWMPPMVGAGTFMIPYASQLILNDMELGNWMLQVEQQIPNPARLKAKKRFIASQGNIELASRAMKLNELKGQAKHHYFKWIIAEKRIAILQQHEPLLLMMKKTAEIRLGYQTSDVNEVFKVETQIADNRNMVLEQEEIIRNSRISLNVLMNVAPDYAFEVDTSYSPVFRVSPLPDTSTVAAENKAIGKMEAMMHSMQLNIASMKKERKPEFMVHFDQMFPLSPLMPNNFSFMGMVTIPIVPWSSGMYRSGLKAMEYNLQAMKQERAAMLLETQAVLVVMQKDIQSMNQRIAAIVDKILPALQKMLDINLINYQQYKLPLNTLMATWEALALMQSNVLDEKLKLYLMITDYDQQLFR